MTLAIRVFRGAAFGALLTLLLHPISRPYFAGLLTGPSANHIRALLESDQTLKPPSTVREAAEWTLQAAGKMASSQPLTKKELSSLLGLVREAKRMDRANAYWTQMESVFESRLGDQAAARASWIEGTKKLGWNDYQSDRLKDQSEQLSRTTHETQSWQLAYLYRQRSRAAADLIESFARQLVGTTDLNSTDSLTLRYATVANGGLLRDGAKNVVIGQIGVHIVEARVSRRPGHPAHSTRPILAENDLFNKLIASGQPEWATYVQEQFGKNDAWQALSTNGLAEDQARDLGVVALILAVLPGATLAVGLIGATVWGFGALCEKAFPGKSFGWPFPVFCGVILGLLVYLLTSFLTAAFASALCGFFLTVSPSKQRSTRRRDFGPTFGFTIGALATAAGLSLGAFLVWGSGPAVSLLPSLSVPSEYFGGSPLFIGLAVLFFSMVFLVTPFWSLAQHMPTPFVFAQGMKLFGTTLSVAALLLTAVGGPVVIYADQKTSQTLRALLLNEPVYYHLKYGPGS